MKKYIVNIGNEKIEIIQDTNGKFIKPDLVKEKEQFGTALKPACEPIVCCRKPLSEKNVASNVLKHGTGGINVDGCRIGFSSQVEKEKHKQEWNREWKTDWLKQRHDQEPNYPGWKSRKEFGKDTQGRFPANVLFDEEAAQELDRQSESSSRFFYCAKASKAERNMGCEGMEDNEKYNDFGLKERIENGEQTNRRTNEQALKSKNFHPTVKPLSLMRYLVKLVCPKDSICIDPFVGSGTTAMACKSEGIHYIGIDKTEEYVEIARKRVGATQYQPELFRGSQ